MTAGVGQEAALGADLDPVGTGRGRVGHAALAAVGRPVARGSRWSATAGTILTSVLVRPSDVVTVGVGLVHLQVQEAVVGRVQDAEAVRLRLDASASGYAVPLTSGVSMKASTGHRRVRRTPGISGGSHGALIGS